jgi:hypothetical protein
MADYERGYSFSGFQASAPATPLPGTRLDNELDRVAIAIEAHRLRLVNVEEVVAGLTPEEKAAFLAAIAQAGADATEELISDLGVAGDEQITLIEAAGDEQVERVEEAGASMADNLLADGALAPTAAARLLAGENGRAIDWTTDDSFTRATGGTTGGDAMDVITFSRAGPAVNYTADGYSVAVSSGNAVFPYRRLGDGQNRGVFVGSPKPNILTTSADLAAAAWTSTRSSVTLDATKTAPDGSNDVWKLDKDDATSFAVFTDAVQNILKEDRDYTYAWSIWRGDETTVSALQMKPTMTGGTDVLTGNVTFDLTEGFVMNSVNATRARVYPINSWWYRIELTLHNVDNVTSAFSAVFDASDATGLRDVYVSKPSIVEGSCFVGEIPLATQERPPQLTLAFWQALFPGAAAIGDFNGLNEIAAIDFGAGWTSSTGLSLSTAAGTAIDGGSRYLLTDTDAADTDFIQYQKVKALGASDYVYEGFFLYADLTNSPALQLQPQIYTTAAKAPRIWVSSVINKVTKLDNDSAVSNPIPSRAQVFPTSITDCYFVLSQIQNNGGNNLRLPLYPDISSNAGVGAICVSHPFIRVSSTQLITPDNTDSTEFRNDVPLPGDVLEEDVTEFDFSPLAATFAYDCDEIALPDSNGDHDAYIMSLSDETADHRIELYIRNTDGTPELVGLWHEDGEETELVGELPDLHGGRYAIAWDDSSAAIIKDATVIASQAEAPVTVLGITKLRNGSNYAALKQPNTAFLRRFTRHRAMPEHEIYAAGRYGYTASSVVEIFTAAEKARFSQEVMAERTRRLARTRSGLVDINEPGLYIRLGVGQSFRRGAYGNTPPLTTADWLAGKPWADSLMWGGSVRDAVIDTNFDPILTYVNANGSTGAYADAPRQLEATCDNGTQILTPARMAALGQPNVWGSGYAGEIPDVAAIHEFKRLWLESQGVTSDAAVRWIVGSVGSSTDSTLAEISDPTLNPWQQQESYLNTVKTWALANGYSRVCLGSTGVSHGEAAYSSLVSKQDYINGGTTQTYDGAAAWLDALNDYNSSLFGVSGNPLHVVSIPSMHWAKDGLQISRAWRELARTRDDVAISGSSHIGQNSGSPGSEHHVAWGALVTGLHDARKKASIMIDGEEFLDTEIYKVWQKGDELIVGIVAQTYPLQSLPVGGYFNVQPENIENMGFSTDRNGIDIALREAVIEDQTDYPGLIRIKMSEWPGKPVWLSVGDETHAQGRNNVFDSSPDFDFWDYRHLAYDFANRELAGVTVAPGACGLLNDRIKATMVG